MDFQHISIIIKTYIESNPKFVDPYNHSKGVQEKK